VDSRGSSYVETVGRRIARAVHRALVSVRYRRGAFVLEAKQGSDAESAAD
jgi:hypothetical protein